MGHAPLVQSPGQPLQVIYRINLHQKYDYP